MGQIVDTYFGGSYKDLQNKLIHLIKLGHTIDTVTYAGKDTDYTDRDDHVWIIVWH